MRRSTRCSSTHVVAKVTVTSRSEQGATERTDAWWLDHYEGFQRHLDRYRRTSDDPATAVIYELEEPARVSAAAKERA